MNFNRIRYAALLLFVTATSCSSGGTSSTPTVQIANIAATAKLQLAVGIATIGSSTGTTIGTNFVTTFRGPDGHSAVLANTPTITGPPSFAIGFPGSVNSVTGLLPNVLSQGLTAKSNGAPYPVSFGAGLGPLVGVFGYGMAADNLLSVQESKQLQLLTYSQDACQDLASVSGRNVDRTAPLGFAGVVLNITSQAQSSELGLPVGSGTLYLPLAVNANCPLDVNGGNGTVPPIGSGDLPINYYGGPPAWPSPQGYQGPAFFLGYPIGFTDFPATPVAGKYALDVAYATNDTSTTYGHFDVNANLTSLTPLPALTISNAVIHPDGSGTVALTVPPGLYETIVFARGSADCSNPNSNTAPQPNYAVVTHSAGAQSFVFGPKLGPPDASGAPGQTFCTANSSSAGGGTAYAVGFDYPAYESSYPFNLSQTPAITNGDGHTGQADVTTSAPVSFVLGN